MAVRRRCAARSILAMSAPLSRLPVPVVPPVAPDTVAKFSTCLGVSFGLNSRRAKLIQIVPGVFAQAYRPIARGRPRQRDGNTAGGLCGGQPGGGLERARWP
jgi:hypothetical protein